MLTNVNVLAGFAAQVVITDLRVPATSLKPKFCLVRARTAPTQPTVLFLLLSLTLSSAFGWCSFPLTLRRST